jgi:hypothetical protein
MVVAGPSAGHQAGGQGTNEGRGQSAPRKFGANKCPDYAGRVQNLAWAVLSGVALLLLNQASKDPCALRLASQIPAKEMCSPSNVAFKRRSPLLRKSEILLDPCIVVTPIERKGGGRESRQAVPPEFFISAHALSKRDHPKDGHSWGKDVVAVAILSDLLYLRDLSSDFIVLARSEGFGKVKRHLFSKKGRKRDSCF